MQIKRKKIICEICLLGLLTIIIYRPALVFCWRLVDHYEIHYGNLSLLAILIFIVSVGMIIIDH
jgi:hypothetical protein